MIHSLLLCVCLLGTVFYHGSCANCSSRKILNGEEGYISDGPNEYNASSDCEWLIDAGGPNKTILLTFEMMATECSYDYLFIYDGKSYTSKLIASLSGDSLPHTVTAFSGHMLLHLFTDRNYQEEGFRAHFEVLDCPWGCSQHGRCENHVCKCERGYNGIGCQVVDCPNNCGKNGECEFQSYTVQYCNCSSGYTGLDCSLKLTESDGQGQWYQVRNGEGRELPARTSHTAVVVEDCIWVFGGFDLNSVLGDLWRFCMSGNRWEQLVNLENELKDEYTDINFAVWPDARSGHAAAVYKDGFYIFGGTLGNSSHSNEMWYFNVTSLRWRYVLTNGSDDHRLRVTGHTLTAVEDYLYLLGGKLEEEMFLVSIYRIFALDPTKWEKVSVMGGNHPPPHLIGHSTAYYKESRSLVVFGGFSQVSAFYSDRTSNVHAFNIDDLYWTHLYNKGWKPECIPFPRAYHSAVIMGNYLVVYGGNTHKHSKLEICYNREMFFYHLGCHVWVNHTFFTGNNMPSKGRIGHVAVVVNGNIMFIVGGYSGQVQGDLIAYKVPIAVAEYQCPPKSKSCPARKSTNHSHCEIYTNNTTCQDDPECVFCNRGRNDSSPKHCVHRDKAELCKNRDYHDSNCPGICPALHTCRACVSQGKGANHTSASTAGRIYIKECSWCVKEAQCQTQSEPFGTCKAPNETASGKVGWWGGLSTSLTTMQQCQNEDIPAGLHWIKYHDPMNMSYPDELSIIRQTTKTKSLSSKSFSTSRIRGFIHPLNVSTVAGQDLILLSGLAMGKAVLYVSLDETPQKKEMVVNMTENETLKTKEAIRRSGRPVFPNVTRGYKYYVEQVISQRNSSKNITEKTIMTLGWNGGVGISKKQNFFTSEYLEPFSEGVCTSYYNCLQCLTDALCGWCEVTLSCLPRNVTMETCQNEEEEAYIITSPAECPSCDDHVQCMTCASDPLCEWPTPKGPCTRRKDKSYAIRNNTECPAPCHERKNCSDCILDKGECAWCKSSQTCLPFAEYVSRYIYGQCTSWLDGDEKQPDCHTCHTYGTCSQCLVEFGCGWCGNDYNPNIGLCLPGDFTDNYGPQACSQLVSESYNLSLTETASWSYDQCPDVEECTLELHNCHPNATCVNMMVGYHCECNRGFEGDGIHECNEMCVYDCVHGMCSGPPHFVCECDLGWTDHGCDISCGCNNHSSCSKGIGICDQCHNNTMGKACDQCSPGHYGDPLDIAGCSPCSCNGHGDESQGICNSAGQCYCIDNTSGDQCDTCKPGYYGNPRKGGKCYLECNHRVYITNITEGALGSLKGSGVENRGHVYCLWILSTLPYGHYPPYSSETLATIALTVEGVDFECGQDAVYVYDGIPSSNKNDGRDSSELLAVFCGRSFPKGYGNTVYARSGILSVYFEGDISRSMSRGFNASYTVYSCPDSCRGNQLCQEGRCVCKPGFWGQGCTISFCPYNCSEASKQGQCYKRMCHCQPGFSGRGCRFPVDENELGLQLLTDSRLPQPSCSKIPEQKHPLQFTRPEILEVEMDNKEGEADDMEEVDDYGPCARAGHSLTACGNGLIFLFGGYSLEHGILNDMWMYNTTSLLWTQIIPSTTSSPGPRYHHAAACIPLLKTLFILGGFEAVDHRLNTKNSKSLWKFNIESHAWSYHDTPSGLPPMAGHTLTYVGATNLLVIGGFSSGNYFNDKVFEYNASSGLMAWREHSFNDMKGAIPIGLYGHSSVHDPTTHTIYIYGGYLFREKNWFVSDSLFTYDIEDREWNFIYPEIPHKVEWEHRVFHAATHIEDSMVVMGGLTKTGNLAMDVLVFRYDCSTWHSILFEDRELEQKTVSSLGLKAVSVKNEIYAFGGFMGLSVGALTKITLPKDICSLIQDPVVCRNTSGCQTCDYILETGDNNTVCYDSRAPHNKKPPGCIGPPPSEKRCDLRNHRRRPCRDYLTCSTCLASHPRFKDGKHCLWCRSCKRSKCVDIKDYCPNCDRNEYTIQSVSQCMEQTCPAADCVRCRKLDNCMWSRYFERLNNDGYNWKCMTTNHKMSATDEFKLMSSPNQCPMPCFEHKSCKSCVDSSGGEGGSKTCVWSELMEECMTPAYIPLRCSLGECGFLYKEAPDSCPVPCKQLTKCADCIKSRACGWNAYLGKNGEGTCIPGSMSGPEKWKNKERYTKYLERGVAQTVTGEDTSSEDLLWSYDKCQPENECLNNHHNCDQETEDCIDNLTHFKCQCKHGFLEKASGKCVPVCHEGCGHGKCVRMDECQCDFGWVGKNCSVECQCNKHSYCESIHHVDNCTDCQHNTKGTRCELCKPMFVGNPVNGGECEPCEKFCYNHTKICMTKRDYDKSLSPPHSQYRHHGYEGPSKLTALCFECQHNTTGDRCDSCTIGHFRKHSENKTNPCRPCHCNGHSNICNTETGENCQCKNNTETNCDSKEELECWEHQCAHCKEYFLGKPTNGHQCYRQMIVDRDYCFDPDTQNNCNQYPQDLTLGRTVFFAVQPKYLNVDIRITIDVTMGAADIFLSSKQDTFQVFLEKQNWHHDILIDKMYTSDGANLARRSLHGSRESHTFHSDTSSRDHENITVRDDPGVNVISDSDSIVVTEFVPDFLKIHKSDPTYYKLSQFRNIDEWSGKNSEEKRDGKKREGSKDNDVPLTSHGKSDNGGQIWNDNTQADPKPWTKRKTKKKIRTESFRLKLDRDAERVLEFLNTLNDSQSNSQKGNKLNISRWQKFLKRKMQTSPLYGVQRDKYSRNSQEEKGKGQRRFKRSVTVTDSRNDKSAVYNGQIKVGEINAGALNTYITVNHQNSVLVVRNVRFRLVVTLPRDQHDLKSTRFYIIVRSRGGKANNSTFGNLYFRQDQPHIDLFVFFSVFFSCFFLFLALCVMFWKLRQSFDARRSRQMREREMECMASRPFAKILVLLEPDGPVQPPISTGFMRRRSRLNRIQNRNQYPTQNELNSMTVMPPVKDLSVVPIAIEPTDDGQAAVGTVLFQLPGGATSHSHLCLGSSLTTRLVTAAPSQKVANLRRRTSASSC